MEPAIAERAPAVRTGRSDNPYVGPRPLQSSDTLYGRTRDLHELGDLLIAERIMLLYSPSGAGKTSLINAGLSKRLREQERFRVLPPLRVNLPGTSHAKDFSNRYMRSVVECLLADLSSEQRQTLVTNAMPCLSDYLSQRPHRVEDGPVDSPFELLIFDQFEEICTLDPTDIQAKEAFFREVGDALRDRHRWALFVIREDHLAEIEAFSHLLPTALSSRYRLNLLTIDQARQAIAGPAAAAGRPFAPEQVDQLANDLATVTLLGPAGPKEAIGTSVEPVQLQVVCRRLWQSHGSRGPAGVEEIRAGAVDEALAGFYDAALERVAHEQQDERPKDRERRIRDWIEQHLIIKPGIRNQILRGHQYTEELPDDCVSALVAEHLLRVDARGGREWIEITHDRMIAPIVNSNDRWRERHLHMYQLRAELWDRNKRSPDMLLSQKAYDEAQRLRGEHPGRQGEVEEAFIEASGAKLRQAALIAESQRRMRLLRRALFGLFALAVPVLGMLAAYFWHQEQRAKIEQLNGEALSLPSVQYQVTLGNAVEAYGIWQRIDTWYWRLLMSIPGLAREPMPDVQLRNIHAAMLAGLVSLPPVQTYGQPAEGTVLPAGAKLSPQCSEAGPAAVRQLAFNPVRKLLAAACADGTVALWNLERPTQPPERRKARGQAWSVAFNPAGDLLAVGSSGGAQVWRIDPASGSAGPAFRGVMHELPLPQRAMALAFDPDNMLAIAQDNGDVSVRDANRADLASVAEFSGKGKGTAKEMLVLTSITFMRNGKLAFADWGGNIRVWPWRQEGKNTLAPGKTVMLNFFENGPVYKGRPQHDSGIADLAYHAETDQLAAAGWFRRKPDGSNADGHSYIAVWARASTAPRLADRDGKEGRERVSHALAFSPDGSALAYSGGESRVLSFMASPVLSTSRGSAPAPAAPVRFQERLFSVAFSPYETDGGKWVAVGEGERISLINLGRTGSVAVRPLPLTEAFDVHAPQHLAAMSGDGRVVAVAAGTKLAVSRQAGDVGHYAEVRPLPVGMDAAIALAIAQGGELVAAAGPGSDPVMLFDRERGARGQIPSWLCPDIGTTDRGKHLAFQPRRDGKRLAIANGRNLCIFDLSDLADLAAVERKALFRQSAKENIKGLAYSADGSRLAVLEGDNIIRVHDEQGKTREFVAPVTSVKTLSFTPERGYLALGTNDADIWIVDLDAETGGWTRLDQLHDAAIKSIHFSGNAAAKLMVSSDDEGRIIVWARDRTSATRYNRLGRPLTQRGPPVPTALSDDGKLLMVGGAVPRLYDLRIESMLRLACLNVDQPDVGESDKYRSCRKE